MYKLLRYIYFDVDLREVLITPRAPQKEDVYWTSIENITYFLNER